MNGSVFDGSSSLRTSDNCRKGTLLENFEPHEGKNLPDVVNLDGQSLLATIDNVLTKNQCNEIIRNSENETFDSMLDKYMYSQRNNSRRLVLDNGLSSLLWNILEPCICSLMEENGLSCEPLGFDVMRGDWKLAGLNEAFRVNRYAAEKHEFFYPHKDAQFCPSGDRRSLFTLLIYLSNGFSEGETNFYFPKVTENSSQESGLGLFVGKDMTIQEEIDRLGGLENGYVKYAIIPSPGKVVVFSQNILHESLPVQKNTKYILKTDVIVKRVKKMHGFSVSPVERDDYLKCLNYFREAQTKELQGDKKKASELYERALSIRYCYPGAIKKGLENNNKNMDDIDKFFSFPCLVWHQIFNYLSGRDIEFVVRAFPDLWLTQKTWEVKRLKQDEDTYSGNPLYIPHVVFQRGMYTCFKFKDSFFFSENEESCVRVVAMYAFYLLGHKADDKFYTVKYNPDTQEVTAVALKSLLSDAFLSRPCYGAVYAVKQQDCQIKNLEVDFQESVDRTYMSLRHNAQFVGGAVKDKMKVRINWPTINKKDVDKFVTEQMKDDDSSESSLDSSKEEDCSESLIHASEGNCHADANDNDDKRDPAVVVDPSEDCEDGSDEEEDVYKEEILKSIQRRLDSVDDPVDHFVYAYDLQFDDEFSSFDSVIREVTRFENMNASCHQYAEDEPEWFDDWWKCQANVTNPGEAPSPNNLSAKELFLSETVDICEKKPAVSAALVSSLKKPTCIDEPMCFCYWPGGEGFSQIKDSCDTECMNHLVFDFSSHQMIVNKERIQKVELESSSPDDDDMSKNLVDEENCLFYTHHYDVFAQQELLNTLQDIRRYKVEMVPILQQATPFNHASCNCYIPSFEIEECQNLYDYPMLNHIHVISGVNSETNEVLVWTAYGGITAL